MVTTPTGFMRIENNMPEEMATVTTTTCTDGEGWVLDLSSGKPKTEWCFKEDKIYHDKISRALGPNYYVKNNMLFKK